MGHVFLAEDVARGRRVAVKVAHQALALVPAYVDRMRAHSLALAQLSHPELIRVLDAGQTAHGCPYIVTELLEGRTLKDEIEARGALPLSEAIAYARGALRALTAAHAAGLVHRDVKLSSLFRTRGAKGGPLVKLIDFGIAKLLGRTVGSRRFRAALELDFPTRGGALYGAPRCLSPEQALGLPADARTDIYGLGVALYSLVCGRGPFDHASGALEAAEAHAFEVPAPPSYLAREALPQSLDAAILRAMAKMPAERFQSAAAFGAELSRVASSLPSRAVWRSTLFEPAF
jgi:eukaryotic-like serine/threonine-protein kinase